MGGAAGDGADLPCAMDSLSSTYELTVTERHSKMLGLGLAADPGVDPGHWANYMTGPPFSCAIVAVEDAVGLVHLDGTPPTQPAPETNLTRSGGLRSASVVRTPTTTTVQFAAHQVGQHPVQ